ncbi:MAG: hypothetical protein KAG43_06370 [Candidatus Marithrix sp.]|nr:hypothetical protein [Candidatus Marithrix sp.]
MLYFTISIVILALLLFFPVSKIIWVMSVRRLQRKLKRELVPDEINGQLNRARFISAFIVILFSILFNLNSIGFPT